MVKARTRLFDQLHLHDCYYYYCGAQLSSRAIDKKYLNRMTRQMILLSVTPS